MIQGQEKIPQSLWWYVAILTVVVIILWHFFWPKEFRLKDAQSEGKSMGEIFNQFTDSFSQGSEAFNQIVEGFKNRKQGQVSADLVDQLVGKVNQELWQERIAEWQDWTNQQLSFRLPTNWLVQETAGKYIISSFNESLSLQPIARAKIEVVFQDNPTGLNTQAWQLNWQQENNFSELATTSSEIISGISGLKLSSQAAANNQLTEYIFLPLEKQLVEITVYLWGNNGIKQVVDDFKKTIKFY